MSKRNPEELFERWCTGTATDQDIQDLKLLTDSFDGGTTLTPALKQLWENIVRDNEAKDSDSIAMANVILSKEGFGNPSITSHRVHFLRTTWFRVAVAVSLFIGIGAYLWLQPSTEKPGITQTKPVPEKNDVLPGGNRAILKLADGSEIVLDSAATGQLAQQSGANIEKTTDGQIVYSFNKSLLAQTVAYNTMSTPRGGQYQLALPDGSKVWLNAESSITFPTAFTGGKREVSVTGEAYFEVKKSYAKPFLVRTRKESIMVLGTSFNVNAYQDEAAVKTSLLEGSVKVGSSILMPGQAYVNGRIVKTNLPQDVAWKNGAFNFENMDLKAAFRLLSRWYDVEIEYNGAIPAKEIRGEMGRDLTLSEVLKALDELGIHTKLEGTTVVVFPE